MQNLQYFEPDIIAETLELAERIRIDGKQGLQPVDIMTLTRYYALDLVGLIALGDRFELVKEGNQHFIVELLDNVVKALIPVSITFVTRAESDIHWYCSENPFTYLLGKLVN